MECKNCNYSLTENAQFCDHCGAKVVTERITFKALLYEAIINIFGLDSKFFVTLRTAALQPHVILQDVLSGVRKRYMNPFGFLAVGAAISLLVFNYFSDDFKRINSEMNSTQIEGLKEKANLDIASMKNLSAEEIKKLEVEKKTAQFQLKFNDGMLDFMLQYYNILAFLFVFLYALLSKWTFWKPHNFGEHIVMNAYLYGFTTYLSLILFGLSLVFHPSIYLYSVLIYILYYMYAFGKFYNLSIGKNLLKLLRFIVGLLIVFVIIMIIALIIGIALAYFNILQP